MLWYKGQSIARWSGGDILDVQNKLLSDITKQAINVPPKDHYTIRIRPPNYNMLGMIVQEQLRLLLVAIILSIMSFSIYKIWTFAGHE